MAKRESLPQFRGIELTLPSGAYGWKTDREEEVKELTASIEKGENIDKDRYTAAREHKREVTISVIPTWKLI